MANIMNTFYLPRVIANLVSWGKPKVAIPSDTKLRRQLINLFKNGGYYRDIYHLDSEDANIYVRTVENSTEYPITAITNMVGAGVGSEPTKHVNSYLRIPYGNGKSGTRIVLFGNDILRVHFFLADLRSKEEFFAMDEEFEDYSDHEKYVWEEGIISLMNLFDYGMDISGEDRIFDIGLYADDLFVLDTGAVSRCCYSPLAFFNISMALATFKLLYEKVCDIESSDFNEVRQADMKIALDSLVAMVASKVAYEGVTQIEDPEKKKYYQEEIFDLLKSSMEFVSDPYMTDNNMNFVEIFTELMSLVPWDINERYNITY